MRYFSIVAFTAAVTLLIAAPVYAARNSEKPRVKPRANVQIKPAKWTEITSSSLEVSDSGRKIVYGGNVLAKGEFTLCANVLTLIYEDNGILSDVNAEGSVGVVHGGRAVVGDKAFYDKDSAAIVVSGNARAMQCGTEVVGERITFYLKSDSVNVDGGTGRVRAVLMPGGKQCDAKKKSGESTVCAKPR